MKRFIPALLGLGLLLELSGCGQVPVKRPPEEKPSAPAATLKEDLRQAAALEAKGEFTAAAEIYARLAAGRPPAEAVDLRLRQARALLAVGEAEAAAQALKALAGLTLPTQEALRARLLRAEIALARHDARTALEWLTGTPPMAAPGELKRRWFEALARARRLSGDLVGSAEALAQLDLELSDPRQRLEVETRLLRTLSILSAEALKQRRPSPPGVFGGWIDLTLVLKGYDRDPEATRRALAAWRQAHPGHPALPDLIRHYLSARDQGLARMEQVAVLLPARGRYAKAARAVIWGLLAAWYQTPQDQRGHIRFYDSSDPGQVPDLVQQALASGATALVGPLRKPAVEALAAAGPPPLPVLALNWLPEDIPAPDGLLQLALAPEDEAAQSARRILAEGPAAALALVPQGPRGERLAKALDEAMATGGGVLADTRTYDPKQVDFRPQIEPLLGLDASSARHRALQTLIRRHLEFVPRRRQDARGLFLSANPALARQLVPQLVFLRLDGLPLYATSRVNPFTFDPIRDLDLMGIRFTEIPWLVQEGTDALLSRSRLAETLPEAKGRLARLVALGIDAYRVLGRLQDFQDFPGFTLPGATGELSLDDQGRFHRRLVWMEVTADGILPLDRPAPPPGAEGQGPTPSPGQAPSALDEEASPAMGGAAPETGPAADPVEVETPGSGPIPLGGPDHAAP